MKIVIDIDNESYDHIKAYKHEDVLLMEWYAIIHGKPLTNEDCISRQALLEHINNAEENFKYDNMESISSDCEDPFVDGVLSGIFNIRQMVIQAQSVTPKAKG